MGPAGLGDRLRGAVRNEVNFDWVGVERFGKRSGRRIKDRGILSDDPLDAVDDFGREVRVDGDSAQIKWLGVDRRPTIGVPPGTEGALSNETLEAVIGVSLLGIQVNTEGLDRGHAK